MIALKPAGGARADLCSNSGIRFAEVEFALDQVRCGRLVVLVDDENVEREGNLTVAATLATPEAINFMATHGRGIICMPITPERCDELGLALMAPPDAARADAPAFTVSIEARVGVTTGISAFDRSRTVRVAASPTTTAQDLVSPGHVLPLRARAGGVLEHAGKAEAAVDLARLAGLAPVSVICGIMNEGGEMASLQELAAFCERHDLALVRIRDLVAHRRRGETSVRQLSIVAESDRLAGFQVFAYEEAQVRRMHLVLVKGDVAGAEHVPLHLHGGCLGCRALGKARCECQARLERALREIDAEGRGVIVWLGAGSCGDGVEAHPSAIAATPVLPRGCTDDGREPIVLRILEELGLASVRDAVAQSAAA